MPRIHFLPDDIFADISVGTTILEAGRIAGLSLDAPCGGNGVCGKCKVYIGDQEVKACQYTVTEDLEVTLPGTPKASGILTEGVQGQIELNPVQSGEIHISADLGTTTIVVYLLDGKTGNILGTKSCLNPQYPYGADVISRIQAAQSGDFEKLTSLVRASFGKMIQELCQENGKRMDQIGTMAVVGNPAMQQLFLGISPENLTHPPFSPVLLKPQVQPLSEYFADAGNGVMLIVPDIAGYVGADTVSCILSTEMYRSKEMTLMIDIGTNGEMVLGNCDGLTACSTAAGPALEGGRISCGMRGGPGAVDHIWMEGDTVCSSVIGTQKIFRRGMSGEKSEVKGLCGSGLIDGIAVMLEQGVLNKRGRIQKDYHGDDRNRIYDLTDQIFLSQEDIREVQMAKGAISAGIRLLAEFRGLELEEIDRVVLCGAFGTYMKPESAARIGLIPMELLPKVEAGGNAAGTGSRQIALNQDIFCLSGNLAEKTHALELASLPQFQRVYAKCMAF